LENAGVEIDEKGYIKVDKFEMTTKAGIYAIGDVTTTGYELTPVAIAAVRNH
jgi:glutathione reductase (NADPH)